MTAQTKKIIYIVAISLASLLAFFVLFSIVTAFIPSYGEEKTWNVEHRSVFDHFNIDVDVAEIRIENGDKFTIRSNLKYLDVLETEDGLYVVEKDRVEENNSKAFLTITIPETISFGDVEITFGAGKFYAERLSAKTLNVNHGTGEADVEHLYVSEEMNINDGAGKIIIRDGSIHNLHFNMGIGELNIRAEILGHSDLHFGMGEATITLLGTYDIYTISVTEHIGGMYINEMDFTNESIIGDGENHIEINGGAGPVNIFFE